MTAKPDMRLADVFLKLDEMAASHDLSEECSIASRDSANTMRAVIRLLGVNPAEPASGIVAAVEALQDRFRAFRDRADAPHKAE